MLFQAKRFLKEEIVRLEYRVRELEERICPAEEHDWKRTAVHRAVIYGESVEIGTDYLCRRCGKRKREYDD